MGASPHVIELLSNKGCLSNNLRSPGTNSFDGQWISCLSYLSRPACLVAAFNTKNVRG